MAERPLDVINEFIARANDAAGVFAVSVVAIAHFCATLPRPANPTRESSLFVGHGEPNAPDAFAYQRWRFGELDEKLGPDGVASRILGQQWVVLIASLWNEEFRGRLAIAKGMTKGNVVDPVLADINRMRNDIVHHNGIATATRAAAKRCAGSSPMT